MVFYFYCITLSKISFTLNDLFKYRGLTKQEQQVAKRNIFNAVKDISPSYSIKPATTKFIIDFGNNNVITKIGNDVYRIYYRPIDNWRITVTNKIYSVISKHDYGILSPISVKATPKFIYAKIRLVEYYQGADYNKIHTLLKKALNVTKHGLLFIDFQPYNLGTINSNPIITDYDMIDKEEIIDIIMDAAKVFKIKLQSIKTNKKCTATEKAAIFKACERNIDKGIGMMYNYLMICLIAYSKGYTDCYRFARLHLNDALWVCKFNIDDGQWNRSRYQFLLKTPFGLL